MTVQEVVDQDYFHYILDKAANASQLVVVDVVVVDIETCPDFEEFSKVATTYVAEKDATDNKTKVDEILGAHHLALEKLIKQYGGVAKEGAEE
ncbi:hypothetical protein BGZ97_012549 [Linnemannia gamsii]|uniref:Uncharacterized protein n=1 Tax=Linnemannia gamsii TaxID=64522 RepID=A0A9P6R3J3_9FUNG|nr:hypothetical protein BGZ97_012549 [Linnemannia gamsii]